VRGEGSRRGRSWLKNRGTLCGGQIGRRLPDQHGGGDYWISWKHEDNRCGHRRVSGMAAGHVAIHGRIPRMVVARRGGYFPLALRIVRIFLRRVLVQRAHRAIATRHACCLKRGSPQRRPEQQHGHQAHTRGQLVSRSAGNVPCPRHCSEVPEYSTRKVLQSSKERMSGSKAAAS